MKLAKTYEPKHYEEKIYALWESSGAFAPTESKTGEYYSIVMPPPNANGDLHIGHALMAAIEDVMVRYHRMKGDATVYIPGADHAGFETWVVYEKQLEKHGKSRFDFSREDLYAQVWDFVDTYRGNMEIQLRELGASCDWQHMVFTLDTEVINTAYATFKKMWDDDLIYRGKRIVNFCTKHQTSFADIEVEHKSEKGKLWNIAFPMSDGSGELVIATTRPETKVGQSALMVHPHDERYKAMIGKTVEQPLVPGRPIPVIADEYVDMSFGTGVVTVTPGHDPNDFEVAQRHTLPIIELIGHDGKMTRNVPAQFQGYTVLEARQRVVAAMQAADALRGEEEYTHNIGVCYKCGTVIEPLVKEQWFIRMKPLAEKAVAVIEAGQIEFTPASKAKELVAYLSELRDWNISRQIPWGIPIPAFQNVNDESEWIFDTRVDQPAIEVDGKTYHREEDTFDTWFSSGQWPYIVTHAAHDGDLKAFYPTSVMETGFDLLRQWVARMVMLGLYCIGEVPFKQVYMHGMVLDEHGLKMSKSKGNVINSRTTAAEYGSDALRMGLISARSAGQSQAFSISKVVAARNFANKLWNIARYIEGRAGESFKPAEEGALTPQTIADHWVIRQLTDTSRDVAESLEKYRLAEAAERVYHTIWDDVADWYIEASKQQDNVDMLAWVLETSLRLSHPFAPFVTETIWQTLGWRRDNLLISAAWPDPNTEGIIGNAIAAAEFTQLQILVSEVRYVAGELGKGKVTLLYEHDSLIADNEKLIAWLGRLESVQHAVQPTGLRLAVPNREAWLDVDEDMLYEHQSKLEMRLAHARERIENLNRRLDNPNYTKQAPKKVVEETKKELAEQQYLEERLARELEVLS